MSRACAESGPAWGVWAWRCGRLPRALGDRWAAWRRKRAAWRRFWQSLRLYQRLAPPERRAFPRFLYPCPGDDAATVEMEPIYYYQDAWAFERIVQARAARHVDVGSHHKFVALLSKVLPTTTIDLRVPSLPLASLEFRHGSILALPFEDGVVESLSSLCVVEHIGLGRYGDELDPYGSEKAVAELKRVLRPGGDLYVSVPLHNENRVYFNAHRTFTEEYFLSLCRPLELVQRAYIYGSDFVSQRRPGFGVGCFHLRRTV